MRRLFEDENRVAFFAIPFLLTAAYRWLVLDQLAAAVGEEVKRPALLAAVGSESREAATR